MTTMKHPYYMTARDEQREAFLDEIERIVATPEPSARPFGRRVLPIILSA